MSEERKRKQLERVGLEAFRGYGRDDVLYDGYPGRDGYFDFVAMAEAHATTSEKLQVAYEQGKQEAERRKQTDPITFYLQELIEEMKSGSEWYGSDFDKPIWIVEQVLRLVKEASGEIVLFEPTDEHPRTIVIPPLTKEEGQS